jgi:hypothetical protein
MCVMWHFLRYLFQSVWEFGGRGPHFCSNSWGSEVPRQKQLVIVHISWMSLLTTYTTMCKLWDLRVELELPSCSFRQPASCGTRMAVRCAALHTPPFEPKVCITSCHYLRHRYKMTSPKRLPQCGICSWTFSYNAVNKLQYVRFCCSEVEKYDIKGPGWRQHSFDQWSGNVTIVLERTRT